MNIQLHYGNAVATVPAAALAVTDRATKNDLRLLLLLSAEPALRVGDSFGGCVGEIATRLGCTPAQVETSLSFWRGAGILDVVAEDGKAQTAPAVKDSTSKPAPRAALPAEAEAKEGEQESRAAAAVAVRPHPAKPQPASELPKYTSAELADLLDARKEASAYLDECQRVWGKMFNVHEHNIILSLTDYLGLEWDYVLALLAFCAAEQDKRGIKRSLRYVETSAFNFYDEGVTDLPTLQEKLRKIEQMEEVEGQLRRMFGMGERALTPTEKKKFSAWLYDYRYGMDVITRAFEVTVDAKGAPNLKYMDAVLSNWNRDGLRTVADVEAAEAKFQAEKTDKKGKKIADSGEGSFNTDDFFAAAVRRSLGEDFDPNSGVS